MPLIKEARTRPSNQSTPSAADLISRLKLAPHPEGGLFREIYRAPYLVEWRGERLSACTAIYFLLRAGDKSWWHRIPQDELWHFYGGDTLELFCFNDGGVSVRRIFLNSDNPVFTVPGNTWQAARTSGDYSLIGCTVSPGFEFRLFELLSKEPGRVERVRKAVKGFEDF